MTSSKSSILVVDSDRKHLAWLSRVVRTVVHHAEHDLHLDPERDLSNLDLIVANYDGLRPDERQRLFETASSSRGSREPRESGSKDSAEGPRLLLLSAAAEADYQVLFGQLKQHGLTNVLAHDTEVSPTDLIVTIQKILKRDIFGLEKYFGWGVQPFTTVVHNSSDLHQTVEAATEFASNLGVHPRLIENLATVVHELVTNALYNAPVDHNGQARFAHLPRTTPVQLEPGEEVVVKICCDGLSLGISVVDTFGALTRRKTLDYLSKCLQHETSAPSTTKGGAGLGLYMTFGSLNHLVLNIARGQQTEVIGLMDVRGSYRDFVARGKSFNIFVEDPD